MQVMEKVKLVEAMVVNHVKMDNQPLAMDVFVYQYHVLNKMTTMAVEMVVTDIHQTKLK